MQNGARRGIVPNRRWVSAGPICTRMHRAKSPLSAPTLTSTRAPLHHPTKQANVQQVGAAGALREAAASSAPRSCTNMRALGQRSLVPFVIHRCAARDIARVAAKSEHALGGVGMDDVNAPTEGEIDDTHALIALALPPLCALWFFLGLVAGLAFRG
jgi:hypothetical protein